MLYTGGMGEEASARTDDITTGRVIGSIATDFFRGFEDLVLILAEEDPDLAAGAGIELSETGRCFGGVVLAIDLVRQVISSLQLILNQFEVLCKAFRCCRRDFLYELETAQSFEVLGSIE